MTKITYKDLHEMQKETRKEIQDSRVELKEEFTVLKKDLKEEFKKYATKGEVRLLKTVVYTAASIVLVATWKQIVGLVVQAWFI